MSDSTSRDQDATTINTRSGQFAIQKIYIKDISFETPNSPMIFTAEWEPKVDMHIESKAGKINEELMEVVLTVTLTTSLAEKTAYLVEAHVAGIFIIKEFPKDIIDRMAATLCPNILFPFVRELVCDLVTRGGFPQLLLAPVNFEALYLQQKMQEKKQNGSMETGNKNH